MSPQESPNPPRRLGNLMSRACDQEISPHELDELSELLRGDPARIREYCALTSLHLQLSQALSPGGPVAAQGQDLPAPPGCPPPLALDEPPGRRQRHLTRLSWGLAASVAIAVTAWLLLPSSQPAYIARIVQKIDCDWGEDQWGTPQLADLPIGREIRLQKGLMVVEFGSGAEVTFEAPVHFKILGRDRAELSFGRLTAVAEGRARGFAVEMPGVELVDLGTRFGAFVDQRQVCQAHVFAGSVLVRSTIPSAESGQGEGLDQWSLAAGEALRIDPAAGSTARLEARAEQFVHADRFIDPAPGRGGPLPRTFLRDDLLLWLNAAHRLQLDDQGRVVAWGDVRAADNRGQQVAWQVDAGRRPTWVRRAAGDRPAVRFPGVSHLVTTPLATGADVTLACVFWKHASAAAECLADMNGPPSLTLGITPDGRLAGQLFLEAPRHRQPAVRLESQATIDAEANVAVYVYDSAARSASLCLNGEWTETSLASPAAAAISPKIIGCSHAGDDFFTGDLGEFLLFGAVLPRRYCSELAADLMSNYGRQAAEREPRILVRPE